MLHDQIISKCGITLSWSNQRRCLQSSPRFLSVSGLTQVPLGSWTKPVCFSVSHHLRYPVTAGSLVCSAMYRSMELMTTWVIETLLCTQISLKSVFVAEGILNCVVGVIDIPFLLFVSLFLQMGIYRYISQISNCIIVALRIVNFRLKLYQSYTILFNGSADPEI